ncbi:MAG: YcxB family protein [Pirellulales bacterium]|nr:YcxB family protein [Pirellulales bacterium]
MNPKLECRLNEEDLVRFFLYASQHSEVQQRQRRRQRIFIPLLYLMLTALLGLMGAHLAAGLFAVAAVAWFLLWPSYLEWRHRRFFAAHVKENVGESLRQPRVVELAPEGIRVSSGLGEAVFRYSAVGRIVENEGYTYVFIDKAQALVLPHDRLARETIDQLVEQIEQRRQALPTSE